METWQAILAILTGAGAGIGGALYGLINLRRANAVMMLANKKDSLAIEKDALAVVKEQRAIEAKAVKDQKTLEAQVAKDDFEQKKSQFDYLLQHWQDMQEKTQKDADTKIASLALRVDDMAAKHMECERQLASAKTHYEDLRDRYAEAERRLRRLEGDHGGDGHTNDQSSRSR